MESFATHQVKKNVLLFMNCLIERAFADRGIKNQLMGRPPLKDVHGQSNSKRHVALFDNLKATLPITRIIVGPGANQVKVYEFAKSVVSNRVPIVTSDTPFIG
jgi:hypothetical protein